MKEYTVLLAFHRDDDPRSFGQADEQEIYGFWTHVEAVNAMHAHTLAHEECTRNPHVIATSVTLIAAMKGYVTV